MTISKGASWGTVVDRPGDLVLVSNDADLCAALVTQRAPVAPTAGDLHRTVGGRDTTAVTELLELPIDLLRVTTDRDEFSACAHVQLRRQRHRGGWWRGNVLMVMNAEFIGTWQVAARGHPNDGRAESCRWGPEFGWRQRWEARRRLPTGTHVPHPSIETRSFRDHTWSFDEPLSVIIDGRHRGLTRSLAVVVEPDAAVIHA